MKLAPYPISHITNIVTLRALQLDKTCFLSADSATHSMPNVYTQNTSVQNLSKKTGSIWQNDKPAKGEYLSAEIGRTSSVCSKRF